MFFLNIVKSFKQRDFKGGDATGWKEQLLKRLFICS